MEVITGAIEQLAGYKAEWGAGQNRLQYTVSNLMNVAEFTTAARSEFDADFAVEAARLAKSQVLQQGTAMLAQANVPQLAISIVISICPKKCELRLAFFLRQCFSSPPAI